MLIAQNACAIIGKNLLECFLYSPERQALFSLIEHYIPNFPNFTKQGKLDTILRGIYIENEDFLTTNISLTIAVQKFILQTKRFSEENPITP